MYRGRQDGYPFPVLVVALAAVQPSPQSRKRLAYMAPEQTGRMNRSIDTRSDLYSFGVILYEMLTGELPFAAVGKLNRLAVETYEALQQLACLGNIADIATLHLVHGTSEEEIHARLWEAVRR